MEYWVYENWDTPQKHWYIQEIEVVAITARAYMGVGRRQTVGGTALSAMSVTRSHKRTGLVRSFGHAACVRHQPLLSSAESRV
jgi:hypothetical protein